LNIAAEANENDRRSREDCQNSGFFFLQLNILAILIYSALLNKKIS